MLILGIETSCDETSAALVEDGRRIVTSAVHSQAEIHKTFDGVVPEIASRNHLEKILPVLDEALAARPAGSVDAVAATSGPGLIGSLLVGLSAAKAAAYALDKPLIPVNHIAAHMYSPHLFYDIPFPYISLVASGGHTLLYRVHSHTDARLMGSTIDDAVGEAYDKVAKLLGLGYPGGPVIDRLAREGDATAIPAFRDMPKIFPDNPGDRYNFSYSGLKTAVAYRLRGLELTDRTVRDAAAAFQKAAVEMLVRKSLNALADCGWKRLVVSGGVAANSALRKECERLRSDGYEVYSAPAEYCGDNAAMVAGRAFADYQNGVRGGLETDAFSRLDFIRKGKRITRDG